MGVSVQISQTKPEVLFLIQSAFGGKIYTEKEKRANSADCHYLTMRSQIAYRFLEAIAPYCVIKAPQIKLALEYKAFKEIPKEISSTKTPNNIWKRTKEFVDLELEFVDKCKLLNKRGK